MNALRGVLLVVLSASSSAWACRCMSGWLMAPQEGSREVPTNVVLRVKYDRQPDALTATLMKEGSTSPVELTAAPGPGAFLASFTPRAPLEPNTRYTFSASGTSDASFTTGAGEDHQAPSPVVFSSFEFGKRDMGSCGELKAWALKFTGGVDDSTPAKNVLLFAYTGDGSTPAESNGVTSAEQGQLTIGACSTGFQQPADPEHFALRLQAMDLAGNLSPLAPPKPKSRCSTTPELAAVLAVLWLVRRRVSGPASSR